MEPWILSEADAEVMRQVEDHNSPVGKLDVFRNTMSMARDSAQADLARLPNARAASAEQEVERLKRDVLYLRETCKGLEAENERLRQQQFPHDQ